MSFRKNILRISFLVLGFLLTLAYFGAPGPRAKPRSYTQIDINDSTVSSNTTQLNETQLLELENELSEKIGMGINRVESVSEIDELIDLEKIDKAARPNQNLDSMRASIKSLDAEIDDEADRQVIYYEDDSSALAARLVIGASPASEPSKQEQAVQVVLDEQNNKHILLPEKPNKALVTTVTPSKQNKLGGKLTKTKLVSTAQQYSSDLVLENLMLREKKLIKQLLSDIDSNTNKFSANHIDNYSEQLQSANSATAVKNMPIASNAKNNSQTENSYFNGQPIMLTQPGAGLRIGPGMQYILLTVLDEGQAVQTNYNQGNWINVTTKDGVTAWVPARYLKN